MGAYDQTGSYLCLTLGQIALDNMAQDVMITNGAFGFPTYNWNQYTYNYIQYPNTASGWWSGYCGYIWSRTYLAINNCNLIIQNADKLPEGCDDYLAQAYGIRGWNFLNLYHLFCPAYNNPQIGGDSGKGLFIRLETASADASANVERSDLKTSMAQIISDLTYAYENCSGTDTYFFNKKCAALLLARTYLEMNDYANAQKFAEIATDNTFDGSNLMSQDEYQSGFNTRNAEWLWGFQFDEESSNIYASIPSFYYLAKTISKTAVFGTKEYGQLVPGADADEQYVYLYDNGVDVLEGYSTLRIAKSFTEIFKKDDEGIWTDCRALFPFTFNAKDGYVTAKFSSNGTLGVADFPMARIAEAYLIEAEALYMQNNSAKSLTVLNTLQEARNGYVSTSVDIDEIWKERRRELYGEGFALTDLKRLCKPLERTGEDQWSSTLTLPANSPRMMFPIPDDELEYNPFYKGSNADYNKGQNDYWAR